MRNVEECAISGVHVGTRAGNTPQHHLRHFGQQVWCCCRCCCHVTLRLFSSRWTSVVRENGTQILLTHVRNAGSAKVPRSAIDEDGKYQVNVMAHNHFGSSQADPVYLCLEDMGKLGKFPAQEASAAHRCHGLICYFLTPTVIAEAPHIVQITFESTTLAALLQWNTTESLRYLKSCIRLHTGNGSWVKLSFREGPDMEANGGSDLKPSCFQEAREGTEFREGPVRVLGLAPLTEYTFQMRTCQLGRTLNPSCMNSTANSQKSFCSRWSLSVKARSPGKGKLAALMPM